eukprot:173998_1
METNKKQLLLEGFTREQTKLLNILIPVSVSNLIGGFIPSKDAFHNAWAHLRNHIQFTNNYTVVEKVDYGDDYYGDYTFIFGKFKKIPSEDATYLWYVKLLNMDNIFGEWGIGISDCNEPKPIHSENDVNDICCRFDCLLVNGDGSKMDCRNELDFLDSYLDIEWYKDFGTPDFQSVIFNKMDVIGVELKFSESNGELSFFYNGTRLGVAYDRIDCSKRWSLALKCFRPTEKMELMKFVQISTDQSIHKIIRYTN